MGSYEISNGVMIYYLPKELDHYAADLIKRKSETVFETEKINFLIFDFKDTVFMDSSGIALILRAQQRMQLLDGSVLVCHVPAQAKRVLDAAGISRLVTIK